MSTEAQRQPAVIDDTADAPVERTYRVAKTAQSVLGHGPGETFTVTLDPEQERLLLDGGAITIVEPDGQTAAAGDSATGDPPAATGDQDARSADQPATGPDDDQEPEHEPKRRARHTPTATDTTTAPKE